MSLRTAILGLVVALTGCVHVVTPRPPASAESGEWPLPDSPPTLEILTCAPTGRIARWRPLGGLRPSSPAINVYAQIRRLPWEPSRCRVVAFFVPVEEDGLFDGTYRVPDDDRHRPVVSAAGSCTCEPGWKSLARIEPPPSWHGGRIIPLLLPIPVP